MIKVYLPNNLNFLVLNSNYVYIYNNNNFTLVNISSFEINFNNFIKLISLKKKNYLNLKINKNFINLFLFSWENFFFSKLYFIGKGFKIKKIKNNTYLNFNYSHINLIINQKNIIKKIQKNKLLVFSKDIVEFKNTIKYIINIKELNKYTIRGLRKTKQIVYKKKRKSST